MPKITKENIPSIVRTALLNAKLNPDNFPNLPLQLLQSNAIELDNCTRQEPSVRYSRMIVIGDRSKQGTRTSGMQVNVFSFAAVVLSALSQQPAIFSSLTLLIALLGACTISISAEQSAFFLATISLEKQEITLTLSALTKEMSSLLNQPNYEESSLLATVVQLQNMGVEITVGKPPNTIIRHKETSVVFPFV